MTIKTQFIIQFQELSDYSSGREPALLSDYENLGKLAFHYPHLLTHEYRDNRTGTLTTKLVLLPEDTGNQ